MDKDKAVELAARVRGFITFTKEEDLNKEGVVYVGVVDVTERLQAFAQLVRDDYRAELLAGSEEPVAQLHPKHWATEPGCVDWCREVLLYSSNNEGDTIRGENVRTKIYTADQLAAAVLRERNSCLEIADQCADADMHASMAANAIRTRNKP
jgi:hypothetical protein